LSTTILPQFVNGRAGHVPVQMLLLSLVSFAIALVSDSAWGLLASTVRARFARSPRRLQLVGVARWPGDDRPGPAGHGHQAHKLTHLR
jgi:threonine/homoserine/homoserine lactone efflux protein